MEIEVVVTGYLEENCYVLKKDGQALIVDPGDEFFKIKEKLKDVKPLAILITHHHFDHVGALDECIKEYSIPVYDKSTLREGSIVIGPFSFEMIENPGHSKDAISFYFREEKLMLCGDFIFQGSIGRCDLEGGSIEEMKRSITNIKTFPEDITLFPGHGPSTILGEEKKSNFYFTEY